MDRSIFRMVVVHGAVKYSVVSGFGCAEKTFRRSCKGRGWWKVN